ncbi:CBS domain-containing protein [Halalkalicoccus ordinarius]|uniref:CBS domain-containing protein n=1 Tax=Halalkalicoccus ordinarius TaxID=3116651 RepID=UPI00300EA893
MNVADAMTPRPELVTVELPGTRDDALEYLQKGGFSSVPVVKVEDDTETFRGLVSRDSLIENPDEDQLALLLEEVPTITQEATVEELATLMLRERTRRVPVVNGELEGIVTITDVIRAIATGDADGGTEVGTVAARRINAVHAGTPLPVAERELHYADEPYAIVLDDDAEPAGILTEVDVLAVANVVEGEERIGDSLADDDDDWKWESIKSVGNRYLPTRNVELPTAPVSEFMTDDVVTVTKRKTAREVAQLMIRHDIEQIPMMSGNDLVGIVQDSHLLEALDER